MKDTITLTFTIHEAAWFRDAMKVASRSYGNCGQVGLEAWTHGMAKGLHAKITAIHPGEPAFESK